jgi:hypothetical protein
VLTVTPQEVESILRATRGGFFTVTFTKRTTGELRTMHATLNYKGALKGGEAKYDHKAKSLLVVRDVDATRANGNVDAIRSIPWDAVLTINANGNKYRVNHGEFCADYDCPDNDICEGHND